MTTSAVSSRRPSSAAPSAVEKGSATERWPRCKRAKSCGSPVRAASGRSGSSTFTTSAPASDRRCAQSGPAHIADRSTTCGRRRAGPVEGPSRLTRHGALGAGRRPGTGEAGSPRSWARAATTDAGIPAAHAETRAHSGSVPAGRRGRLGAVRADQGRHRRQVRRTGQGEGHPPVGGPQHPAASPGRHPAPPGEPSPGGPVGEEGGDPHLGRVPGLPGPGRTGPGLRPRAARRRHRPASAARQPGWPGQPHRTRVGPAQDGAAPRRPPAAGRPAAARPGPPTRSARASSTSAPGPAAPRRGGRSLDGAAMAPRIGGGPIPTARGSAADSGEYAGPCRPPRAPRCR